MKTNLGSKDKMIRLGVAALVAALYFLEMISGTTAIVLGVVAIILAITSTINFCPLYSIFGISTTKK